MNASPYFSILRPLGAESPLVVEIPHAGLMVDALALATLAAPARALGTDADLYVDELYEDATAHGATVLVAHTSRYVCDLNRGENDVDSQTVIGGRGPTAPHGLIWRRTTDDQPALVSPLGPRELARRLDVIYRPYHRALATLLAEKKQRFGFATLLCAHSMPSRGRNGHNDPGTDRADVVPGSRGRTSAAKVVIDTPEILAKRRGWSVLHDDPYRGGFTTGYYGRPMESFHVVQVELARRLYMDEVTLERNDTGFAKTREYCSDLAAELSSLKLP